MSDSMNLNADQAATIAKALGGSAAGWISSKAIDGPESAAAYVKLACEKLSDRNAHVTEAGVWSVDGDGGVTPAQSAENVDVIAKTKGKDALKAIDDAIKGSLDHDARVALLVDTLYATGRNLELSIGEQPKEVTTAEGDSFDSMPEDMKRQMMELMKGR